MTRTPRVMLFCAAFVAISFFAREQPDNSYVLVKADKLFRTSGDAVSREINPLAHCSNGTRRLRPRLSCLNLEPLAET
jgi:hypothetical protein